MTASESDILAMFDAITSYAETMDELRDSRLAMRQLADVCEENGLDDHARCLRAMLDRNCNVEETGEIMLRLGVCPINYDRRGDAGSGPYWVSQFLCNADLHNVAGAAVRALTGMQTDS